MMDALEYMARSINSLTEERDRYKADAERLAEALVLAGEIRMKVESIERCEEWTDGEPTLGTCRILVRIKEISDIARAALAAHEEARGEMKTCTYDNPSTMCRECWRDGEILYAYSMEAVISNLIPAQYFFFGANIGKWRTGQIAGDSGAIAALAAHEEARGK